MQLDDLLARLPISRFRERRPTVGVIRLAGVIGAPAPWRRGFGLDAVEGAIHRAFRLPRLSAVALAINSPGGSPVQSALIASRIRAEAARRRVPVLAFCEDVAASGGYWLACAADEIYAHEASIIGSIGVISAGFGFDELIARHGIERRIHTAGAKKSLLDPFKPEDPEEIARLKAVQAELHQAFIAAVHESRGARLKGDAETLFSGEFWAARRALELGLIDHLGELQAVLRARFGDKVAIRRVDSQRPWWRRRLLPMGAAAGPPSGDGWPERLLAIIEERNYWARYGL